MSAHVPAGHPPPDSERERPLLVVVDPAARAADGESVRIARDVLRAGAASLKIVLPESAAEAEHALIHRGRRRPVLLGDDAALLRAVHTLYRDRSLHDAPMAVVPIGPRSSLLRALGVPGQVPAAARAALDGIARELDLLVDDSGGIVLGTLSIPCGTPTARTAHWWTPVERTARSLVRTLTAPVPVNGHQPSRAQRLRVEADGVVLADMTRPVHEVSVRTAPAGLAEVSVRHSPDAGQVRARAHSVTVSGRDFRYRADCAIAGPVRTRTWTVEPAAWQLTVPR